MNFNRDFLMGFISGTVVGAVGYRVYEQNNGQLRSLVQQAPQVSFSPGKAELSIEDLVSQKERLEDLIAERQAVGAR
ncbi:hypothetical protein [Metabacillus sp. 84]|uniref:hypothetical protein n=1 Tax=Metabacillus sp. 84 TaxID=3404705 RepID=UPI003CF7C505